MNNEIDPRWQLKTHSKAKIQIIEEYLKAWLPILSSWNDRIVFIDGFCGPGEYLKGEKGSPIVALDRALNHDYLDRFSEINFIFIDNDENCLNHLNKLIVKRSLPKNINVSTQEGNFEEILTEILDYIEEKGASLAPTFLLIDPFGIKGVSYSTIKRFLENDNCEILLTFMIETIHRFKSVEHLEEHLNRIYGTDNWKECLALDPKQQYSCIVEKFEDQLDRILNYKWRFNVVDERNKTQYFLYYGTHHIKGLEKIKDAMWKIAPSGDYTFRAREYNQLRLFNDQVDYNILIQQLKNIFEYGQETDINQIETVVITRTDFRKAHTKTALAKMEENEEIQIVETARKKRKSYPDGTIIRFTFTN